MTFDVSVKVQVKLAIPDYKDIHLEFNANGSNYAEVRAGSEEFVREYVVYHQLRNIKSVEFVYLDKDGLIINTVENFLSNL